MKITFFYCNLLAGSLLLLTSCSRGDNKPAFDSSGRIATIQVTGNNYLLLHTLHYNTAGTRVDSIVTTGAAQEVKQFTYGSGYTRMLRPCYRCLARNSLLMVPVTPLSGICIQTVLPPKKTGTQLYMIMRAGGW